MAMLTSEFDEEANRKNLNWCDVLVIGPGLGTEAQERKECFGSWKTDQKQESLLYWMQMS